jgi:C4-dicarboxylate transporter
MTLDVAASLALGLDGDVTVFAIMTAVEFSLRSAVAIIATGTCARVHN